MNLVTFSFFDVFSQNVDVKVNAEIFIYLFDENTKFGGHLGYETKKIQLSINSEEKKGFFFQK